MKDTINSIKLAINMITILEMKSSKLREELEFFNNNIEDNLIHVGAHLRLSDEVMHLTIDAYSLHQGISKKKSLFSRVIKNSGSSLSRVDKTEYTDSDSLIHLRIFSSLGRREASSDERKQVAAFLNQDSLQARKKLKEESGLKSPKHHDLDDWLKKIKDEEVVERLNSYRREYSHRYDNFDDIKKGPETLSYQELDTCLRVVAETLERYKFALQDILAYTTSDAYSGYEGIEYDSISRIQQVDLDRQ